MALTHFQHDQIRCGPSSLEIRYIVIIQEQLLESGARDRGHIGQAVVSQVQEPESHELGQDLPGEPPQGAAQDPQHAEIRQGRVHERGVDALHDGQVDEYSLEGDVCEHSRRELGHSFVFVHNELPATKENEKMKLK